MLNIIHLFRLFVFLRFLIRDYLLFIPLVLSLVIRHLFPNSHILAILGTCLWGPHTFGSIELIRIRSAAIILNRISLYRLVWIFLPIKTTKLINCIYFIDITLIIFITEHWIVLVIHGLILKWNIYWNIWIIIIHKLWGFRNDLIIVTFFLHFLTLETLVSTTQMVRHSLTCFILRELFLAFLDALILLV